eukprot:6466392-Amphidinium_carterae.1
MKAAMVLYTACHAIVREYANQSIAHHVSHTEWGPTWPLDPAMQPVRYAHEALATYVEPDWDVSRWQPLLLQAEEILTSRSMWVPEEESRFWKAVNHLVPWDLRRITVARTPKARRFLPEVQHTHRGAALLYSDRTIEIEYEDLGDLATGYLKRKFSKPVAIGIFWYGLPARIAAPDELEQTPDQLRMADPEAPPSELPPVVARPGSVRKVNCSPGVYFLVPKSVNVGDEILHVLGRLHCSLGHPDTKALSRLLLAQQVPTHHVRLLEGLHCDHCARHVHPRPPRSATFPRESAGAFGEHVSSDIFYVHRPDGVTTQVLGAVCHTTRLHGAIRLHSRESQHVLQQFLTMWVNPYGYMTQLVTDADGAFRAAGGPTIDWCQPRLTGN